MSRQARQKEEREATIAYELHGNCYLNITYHCTLRCAFCPKFRGTWEVQNFDLRLYQEPTVDAILSAVGDPAVYREIVFCGLGEPTNRWDVLLEVSRSLKAAGAARIRVNTDGLANLTQGRDVTPEMEGLIDALSISMNAHNAELYERHCRPRRDGAFEAMLDFAGRAAKYVPQVTLTAIDGLEGVDIGACERLASEIGVGFRRRVLDVVG